MGAAVKAQTLLQQEVWPEPLVLRVRMGLHTGEAQERDGDYFGPSVNRAARLMAVANGGQIVMSSATADMVEGRLTDGVGLTDLGERELRGVARPERVFGLVWPGAPVFELSNVVIRALKQELGNALPIIGVGGILSGRDAQVKMEAGSALVQLYTGVIYRGPALVKECAAALRQSR